MRYVAESRLPPEEIVAKATSFFGEGGIGLEKSSQTPCCVHFVGGGGYVTVGAAEVEGKTEVELETIEWDHQVEKFMQEL